MPFNDGIDRLHSYSLTDFNDFERCQFRFFVKHHLGKKYEIEDVNEAQALGILLDLAIKKFHSSKAYGQPPEYLGNLVMAAFNEICDKVAKASGPSFYSGILPLLTDELCAKATEIFQNFYKGKNLKIPQSLGEVGFCEWVIEENPSARFDESARRAGAQGRKFKLWGGPDCFELGEDGVPEIVDYKSREDIEKGKDGMDMDLMPKMYTLLCCKKIQDMGYKKVRFVVRFWQDPLENGFYEEFDLEQVPQFELIFKQKIDRICQTIELEFCEREYCRGCKHKERAKFLIELEKHGIKFLQNEVDFFAPA